MKRQIEIPKFDVCVLIFLFLLCFLICAFPINHLNNFYVFGDEFAMYSIGAWFNQYDWSGVTGKIGYYSYGYPLIFIAPLFAIFKDFHLIYKVSIIMNCILASTLIPLSYLIAREWGMKPFKERIVGIFEILAVVLSSCVIVYSTLGLSEVLLIVLFFVITYMIITISNYGTSDHTIVLLSLLSIYIFFVHQRALGIMVSVLFAIVFMFIMKKISKKQLQIYIGSTVVFLLFGFFLKGHVQDKLWNELSSASNDFGGVYEKVISIFTNKKVFFSYCRTVIGQFFYIGFASFGLAYCGIYYIIDSQYQKMKNHKKIDIDLIFIIMSFVSTFIISTIFMSQPNRADQFFYGRYNDIVYIVLILYAFRILSDISLYKKINILFIEVIVFFVSYMLYKNFYSDMEFVTFNVPSLSLFSNQTVKIQLILLLLYLIISGYLMCFLPKKDIITPIIGLVTIIIFSFHSAQRTNSGLWNDQKAAQAEKISEVINDGSEIYFLSDIEELRTAAYFQTEFFDKKVKQYMDGMEGYLIVRKKNIFKPNSIHIKKSYIGETDDCFIFFVDNMKNHFDLFDSNIMKSEFNDDFYSTLKKGFLFYGPYVDLEPGAYVANVTLKLTSANNEDIGFIDIVSDNGQNVINRIDVKKTDFINGEKNFTIPFTLVEGTSDAEVRMYKNDDVEIAAESLSIEMR
ncbi:hypothetical protein FYJ38_19410 [Clostridium sp. WB02_MRS01]|uniref:hypothetical protein n=1 Tax=Clostridium sp. WB02_MRS01 TaxID=2605777 RepID=UPI0012B2C68C|nr:hypothetical protein [Clostridium sp. WB02_MRS01]MSS10795.1 hypothetical protein [Clostridium sp. WB02_MRS01]